MTEHRNVKVTPFWPIITALLLLGAAAYILKNFRTQAYFHLKTGDVETCRLLGNVRLWSTVRESFSQEFFRTISPRMPEARILIENRPIGRHVNLRGAKCPVELKNLFLLSRLQKMEGEEIAGKARQIAFKYRKFWRKTAGTAHEEI